MKKRQLRSPLVVCLHAVCLALVAALAAGCGAPAPGSQPTSLTYAFPNDTASSNAAAALIKAYTAANPGIQIVPLPLPAGDYPQQLLSRLDSQPPDLFASADTQAPMLIKSGALLDLQKLMAESVKVKTGDFQPAALAAWQRDTALYGLPTDITPMVMFYNRDLFAAGGVAEPAPGWSWDDWLAKAKQLSVASGGQVTRYGTALEPWGAMIWGNGGELISADGKRALLDSPEAVAGVQFSADMVTVHHVAPPPAAAGGPDPVQLFKEQQVAMLPAASAVAASLLDAKLPFKWAIAALPAGNVAASPLSIAGLALSARTPNPRAALDFAAWAVGPDGQAVTASMHPFAAPALQAAPARPAGISGAEAIGQSVAVGRTLPQVAQWPAIASAVNEALVPVFQGKTTVEAAYRQMTPKINELLTTG